MRRFYGIDFSGGQSAARKIWMACAVPAATLEIVSCRSARTEFGAKSLQESLDGLVRLVAGAPEAAFGFDFPFTLPQRHLGTESWEAFVSAFSSRFSSPEKFRAECLLASGGKEIKRRTELDSRAPFCSYNLRNYRQAYYGIGGILAPLMSGDLARIAPMQRQDRGKPAVLEVCPASTLRALGIDAKGYKARGADARERRSLVLESLSRTSDLTVPDPAVRDRLLADVEGDALDSVIAALSTWRAVSSGLTFDPDPEGHIYV